jgi:hypothetical protein
MLCGYIEVAVLRRMSVKQESLMIPSEPPPVRWIFRALKLGSNP